MSWASHLSGVPSIAPPRHLHNLSGNHARDIFAKPVFMVRSRRKSASSYQETWKYCRCGMSASALTRASAVGVCTFPT